MDNQLKFSKAIKNLNNPQGRPLGEMEVLERAGYVYHGDDPVTEELFNKIEWIVGVNEENNTSITDAGNPHSHLTWAKVSAEMDKVQAEYDSLDYARKRKAEYPKIEELVVALYDSEDKTAVDEKRAAVKLKYSKP